MERLTERTAIGVLVKEDYGEKALKTLYSCNGGTPDPHYTNCEEGYCAMEKLAAYEDVGAVSTCRNAVEICRAMIERGIEMDNIKEYITFEDNLVQQGFNLKRLLEMMEEHRRYREIGTLEECRAAVDQQMPKRPIMKPYLDSEYLCCPTCGEILTDRIPADNKDFYYYCMNCGQKFDWEEEK